jgi:hypothetical protein
MEDLSKLKAAMHAREGASPVSGPYDEARLTDLKKIPAFGDNIPVSTECFAAV